MGERSAADAELLGALGRAHAAAGRWDDAVLRLDDAIDTWTRLDRPVDASRPLCERLRVAGLLGRGDDVERLCAMAARLRAHPACTPVDDAHLRLAEGRACVALGRLERGAGLLALPDAEDLPAPVVASARRWAARAAGGPAADALRAQVTCEPWRTLAALDARLAAGEGTHEQVEALTADPTAGREVRRTLARCPPGDDPGAFLADHFRY
ncbi:MAG: hypothetical protein R3F59_31245 [Myxococcota bacterium]